MVPDSVNGLIEAIHYQGLRHHRQKRLDNYNEWKEVVRLMSQLHCKEEVSEGEYNGLFNVISDYVYALILDNMITVTLPP